MTTPIYSFPSPTLAGVADGPAAYAALAARMEREQTVLRSTAVDAKEVGIGIAPGGAYAVHSADFAMNSIGWINVEVDIAFGIQDSTDNVGYIAGQLQLVIGGTMVRNMRWHNQGRARLLDKTITGHKLITAANTTMNIQVNLTADAASRPVLYFMSEICVRQFGAPST